MIDVEPLLTSAALSERVGLSRQYLQRCARDRGMPALRRPRRRPVWLFRESEVRSWLADNATTSKTSAVRPSKPSETPPPKPPPEPFEAAEETPAEAPEPLGTPAEELAALNRRRREELELKMAERLGQLIDVESAREHWRRLATRAARRFYGVGRTAAPRIVAALGADPRRLPEVRTLIEQDVVEAALELFDGSALSGAAPDDLLGGGAP